MKCTDRKGKEYWLGPGADLRNADFSGINFISPPLDLRGADLRGASFANGALIRADLRKAKVDNCDFRGVNLYGSDLRGTIGKEILDKNIDWREAKITGNPDPDTMYIKSMWSSALVLGLFSIMLITGDQPQPGGLFLAIAALCIYAAKRESAKKNPYCRFS